MPKEITLSQQELEDIKDAVKFRTMVVLQLKRLNGLPEKVLKLEVAMAIYGVLVVSTLLYTIFKT